MNVSDLKTPFCGAVHAPSSGFAPNMVLKARGFSGATPHGLLRQMHRAMMDWTDKLHRRSDAAAMKNSAMLGNDADFLAAHLPGCRLNRLNTLPTYCCLAPSLKRRPSDTA
jgi:hypothetical protein